MLAPKWAADYYDRGVTYHVEREVDGAIADYTEAIRLEPQDAEAYYNRGAACSAKGDYDRSIADFSEAIRIDPDNAEAYNGLAWVKATCPVERLRDGNTAVGYAEKACELTAWEDSGYFETLAVAYAEAGRSEEAVTWAKKAIEAADYSDVEMAQARLRLALYEERKPYRAE